ncbi:Cation efflux protein [Mycena sanguinolenta]|uniref:Cation efflux protein n=1 Tax=Mycena sanguinolenta TaxID=230812 RepID=A0A8H7DGA2_9AGAR|nr:Cation efflux protein [Mycena sanguinolenta]
MAVSRSTKIKILLAIDIVFFFVELISGYVVGSLALVADSFHMLNDVMSLIVALYAIKLTSQSATDSRYSYGWHRAEILAALINGVFLVALCFSIALEAMERFFSTPEISNPKLVVIVGGFGLASNLVGLFLFHGEISGLYAFLHPCHWVIPCCFVGVFRAPQASFLAQAFTIMLTERPNVSASTPAVKASTDSESTSDSEEDIYPAVGPGHPVMTRASIARVAHNIAHSPSTSRRNMSYDEPSEQTPLLAGSPSSAPHAGHSHSHDHDDHHTNGHSHDHSPIAKPSTGHGHGHGHSHGHSHAGSMNMRALVLHVLGDALGNVGVIATGLIIMLAPVSWNGREVYFDPAISLVIAFIILGSAVPLVRSASFVLLQGVPATISLDQVRAAILAVEGVQSLHELHIWQFGVQLSESKNIASVHVLASREHDFMPIAAKIRKALHDHGIHSCTIQPEYYGARYRGVERVAEASPFSFPSVEEYKALMAGSFQQGSSPDSACLVLCPPEECNPQEEACCPPPPADV